MYHTKLFWKRLKAAYRTVLNQLVSIVL